jgi:hypothetical protein
VKAYKGTVQNGVIVLEGAKLPEGATVTVTIGEGELLRATITNAFAPPKKERRTRIKLNPRPTM